MTGHPHLPMADGSYDGVESTLGAVLENADAYPHGHALYMAPGEPFRASTVCVVHDVDDVVDEELDLPAVAIARGFDYVLDMQTVQGVVANTLMQRSRPATSDLLIALAHYHSRDAFIDWERDGPPGPGATPAP